MASPNSLIIRNANARNRVDAAALRIQSAGVMFTQQPVTNKDKEVAATQQLENFAAAFEAIADHIERPEPTKPKAPKGK